MSETETILQQTPADQEDIDKIKLETFYVYRSLHSDESWGAILSSADIGQLPNIDFGMTVYAINEKRAIARARDLYEKIHKFDTARDNVRRFAASAIKSVVKSYMQRCDRLSDGEREAIAKETMGIALELNRQFQEHFDVENEEFMKGLDGDSST